MGQILMNTTTLLGGVFGLLIGVAVFFMVFVILGLPYLLMTRRDQLKDSDSELHSHTTRLDQHI